jgi:glycine dehydrogenase subunit 1
MGFVGRSDDERRRMLETCGVESFEQLLTSIPSSLRLGRPLEMPPGLSEWEVVDEFRRMASRNAGTQRYVSFLGAGIYDHYVPAAVNQILLRSEFYTAYTPYQAEVSQGTLAAIFEFQSYIRELTGLPIANASQYEAGSATAEAALLAVRATGRRRVAVSAGVHPHYVRVLRTILAPQEVRIDEVPIGGDLATDAAGIRSGDDLACVVLQNPSFFGVLEDVERVVERAHGCGALAAVAADPISLALVKSPGESGADLAFGEGQALGNTQSFGGAVLGFFAARRELVRQMPGRLVGATEDVEGNRGFVLTLQTREQQIRREKATSNICTNAGLLALASTVYLALLGRDGLRGVAARCLQRAHRLAEVIGATPGFRLVSPRPFFKEFTVATPIPAGEVIAALRRDGILAGVDLSRILPERRNQLLVAVTERRTEAEIARYGDALKRIAVGVRS